MSFVSDDLLHKKVCEFIDEDKQWRLEQLHYLLPLTKILEIMAISLSILNPLPNKAVWNEKSNGTFSTSSEYGLLQVQTIVNLLVVDLNWLWWLECTERARLFLWTLYHNNLNKNEIRRNKFWWKMQII